MVGRAHLNRQGGLDFEVEKAWDLRFRAFRLEDTRALGLAVGHGGGLFGFRFQ